ncbi:MAG: 6-pyruvoyl-tetrahydropterin synthase-related protein [Syntrophobacteraceae bacterium]|nr:6-pyruvoyl-tetrahydropterin synthase-related protein [Syntrophobacteraceae bacterium]
MGESVNGKRPSGVPEDTRANAIRSTMLGRITPSILLLLLAEVLLLLFFPAPLIFKSNLTAGGDTPVHFLAAVTMNENLLSFFSPVTWVNGAFGGFPLFLNYFPLPFWLMALISRALPLQIAFKLVTLLAILPLPGAVYLCLRRLGYGQNTPGIGALLSLLFLVTTSDSMWGGNICSTLAGEFAYSLSFILYVIFTGKLYADVAAGRSPLACSIIEALMALCSGYPVLQAAAGSSYFLARGGKFKFLLRLHAAAAGLTAFWLLPLLWRLPWNTSYSFAWHFDSFSEIAPPLLWPSVAGTLMLAFSLARNRFRSGRKLREVLKEPVDSPEIYLFWQLATALLGFSLATSLGLADARFLPFAQMALVLLGAVGWGRILSRLPKPALCLTGFCAATVIFALTSAPVVGNWITWNYSGMESKPLWNSYRQVNDWVKGDENSPRAAWEHNDITTEAGTIRAFELLPYFSGRSALAGLYMQSALNAPFVYYLQSELAETPSCPFEQYYYSRPDPGRAAAGLRLFNVSRVVAVSADMADAFNFSPDYELLKTLPPYAIFRVKGCSDSYVQPLRFKPLRIPPRNWKKVQFEWFRKSSLAVPLVVASKNSPGDFWKTLEPYDGHPRHIPAVPIPGSEDTRAKAVLDKGKITIDTSKPGFPLWIKVSYHPDWRVTTGRAELYPASPAFMLLVPKTDRVVLTFDTQGGIYLFGRIVFLLTILLLATEALVTRFAHSARQTGAGTAGEQTSATPPGRLPGPNGRFVLSFALMATIVATGVPTRNYRDPVLLYRLAADKFERIEGEALFPPKARRNARPLPPSREESQLLALFDTCMTKFGHSVVFDNCQSCKARLMAEHGMWIDLRSMLERHLEDNPDTRLYAQALFLLGKASLATGRREDAQGFFRKALFTWPPDEAVKMAGVSLAKIVGPQTLIKTGRELTASGKYLEACNIYAALALSADQKTREQIILPLAYCDFRLNRLQEAADLFIQWLGPNFDAPGSEQVKADLRQCRAIIAHNREGLQHFPDPGFPSAPIVRILRWAKRLFN